MQIIKRLFILHFFIAPFFALAQSSNLNQGSKEQYLIERLMILQPGGDPSLLFTGFKPYNRKHLVEQTGHILKYCVSASDTHNLTSIQSGCLLSRVDRANLQSILVGNHEWDDSEAMFHVSRKTFGPFYKTKADFFSVDEKDFFLSVNPVLQLKYGHSGDSAGSPFLNSRGITLRGLIAGKLGFSSTVIENQERGPYFYHKQVSDARAVPGVGFYKTFKGTALDYFDARGYVSFNAAKYVDIQFGFDKHFIGNGFRSLFLSDWGNSYLFLKFNTRIWKLNYQNLYMELMPQFSRALGNTLLDRKYAAMHHLSVNVKPWLNIGFFESVVFGRTNRFDFQYLNPIIFFRHVEGALGSKDNAIAGFEFKTNLRRRVQLYGQWILDEFLIGKVKSDPTNWVNKFGFQMGGKYVDAFGIRNLDLQVEWNRVRPFTYSHKDSVANYTHYNQPLAHPLGSNFRELVGIVRYQPTPRWVINARLIGYFKGLDSNNANFGGNIFRDYASRVAETGFKVGSGNRVDCINALAVISYEFRENLFFECSYLYRSLSSGKTESEKTNLISAGIRMNMYRRDYDF
jgi:hypothetical protein